MTRRRPAWSGSTRAQRLPPDWPTIRARILRRDHGICHVCARPGADQVDHLRPGDDHTDANLAAIHAHPCHARKSSAEGHQAQGQGPTRHRTPEPHPGTTNPDPGG